MQGHLGTVLCPIYVGQRHTMVSRLGKDGIQWGVLLSPNDTDCRESKVVASSSRSLNVV
jgi:hypothetical protein